MKLRSISKDKKGMSINDLYPVILIIATVAILLAVVMFVLGEFGDQMTENSSAYNATSDIIDDFTNFVPWIGIILLVVAAAIVLGVVISSFGGKAGGRI
ncbi:MAG: hypothetical protein ACTSXY_12350 [Promethearchaeota archaeon]